jgi:4-hydroxy-tetrahydrodipicolinate synthase
VRIPVIVQDASGYVGNPMPIVMQARLLEEFGPERVLYKPEASPIGPKLTELREATAGRARVFEGTGGIALVDSFKRGVVGTMPGADLTRGLVPLWNALQAGDMEKADRIHGPLAALVSMQTSLDAFLAVEKHLLVRQGIFKNTLVRGPVGYHLDEETKREVDRLFDRLITAAS